MRPTTATPLAALATAALLAGCELPPGLDEYCPDDPTVAICPGAHDLCTPYACISFCVRNYPDRQDVPDSGMGSWCDDPRLPDDYGEFCGEHSEARGCPDYCDEHPEACGGGDGDADSDMDVEPDGGDGDGDTDADEDPDTDQACETSDECDQPSLAHCSDEGLCVPCEGASDCAHLTGLPVCDAGECVECTPSDAGACTGETLHCDPATHTCVECLSADDCTSLTAPRCEAGTCAGCTADGDCTPHAATPACNTTTGACVECTATNETACTGATSACLVATNTCVQCTEAADCPTPTASRCHTDNTCQACTDDAHCTHVPGLPVCAAGTCVECSSNDDCGSAELCAYAAHTCFPACHVCTHDSDCAALAAGLYCVNDDDFAAPTHCVQAGTSCERPWRTARKDNDGGGGVAVDVCIAPATTTCLGIMELGGTCDPATSILCGEDGVGSDATCPDVTHTCTYYCAGTDDCPVTMTCSGVPAVCQ